MDPEKQDSEIKNRKSSLKFTIGQDSCLISDFATPSSNKAVLVKIFLRFEMSIFNNNCVFCMMSFLCSMARVACRKFINFPEIKCTNLFYPCV